VWPPVDAPAATDVAGEPLIGCFGNLNVNKRIPQLLEAFTLLLDLQLILLLWASCETTICEDAARDR